MRTRFLAGGALLLAAAALFGAPSDRALAGDDAGAPALVYDVHVVRVDPPAKEGAEAPGPFASMTGTTTTTEWPALLAILKQRGATTLLMDQRITTLEDVKCAASSDRSVPVVAVNFRSSTDEQLRSTVVRTGCKLDLMPQGGTQLTYALEVRWSLQPPADNDASQQFLASWSGAHPRLDGRTLVLHYREQVPQAGDAPARAVEIYAFLRGRVVTGG